MFILGFIYLFIHIYDKFTLKTLFDKSVFTFPLKTSFVKFFFNQFQKKKIGCFFNEII